MIVSIVYATEQGLGRLAREFFEHGVVKRVMVKHHQHRRNHYDWYPDRVNTASDLFYGATVLLCFETPFYPELVTEAKRRGIRTFLMPMYECTTDGVAGTFDRIINPSLLDQETFPWGTYIPVPVERPFKLRKTAKVFVHNAGHGGLGGRNGTAELLEAMQYVESPIKLIIRSQSDSFTSNDPRVQIINKEIPYDDLWTKGDVFVFPEKFNGLSLPIQEAFASGMVVMATDRHPNNTYLPKESLIPVQNYTTDRLAREIKVATIDPRDIARSIDQIYGRDISHLSRLGQKYGEIHSWRKLKKRYLTELVS